MKKFSIGLLAGYLLTSIFSIPALPDSFWFFSGGIGVLTLILWSAWKRFNDDLYEGEF
jgi:hypothetical protein